MFFMAMVIQFATFIDGLVRCTTVYRFFFNDLNNLIFWAGMFVHAHLSYITFMYMYVFLLYQNN